MKKLFRVAALLLLASVVFSFASCGKEKCKEHEDKNGDKICDVCDAALGDNGDNGGSGDGKDAVLVSGGKIKAKVVVDIMGNLAARNEFVSLAESLSKFGLILEIVNDEEKTVDTSETAPDYEILVGAVTSRGDKYNYDYRKLGPKGKACILLDDKIIIAGGSEDALLDAVKNFIGKVFNITEQTNALKSVTVSSGYWYEKPQDPSDYRWSSVSVNDTPTKDYKIYADTKNKAFASAAETVRQVFYNNAGYWLEIAELPIDSMPESGIVLNYDSTIKSLGGFKAYVDGKTLVISTYYPDKYAESLEKFIDSNLLIKKGDVNLSKKLLYTEELRYIKYEDFGAVGDGRTDDFDAMKAAHDYANEHDHIIRTSGKYYIGNSGSQTIRIKTDVQWLKSNIIIDDKVVGVNDPARSKSVFVVVSDYSAKTHKADSELVKKINAAGGIPTDTTQFFGYEPGYPAMIIPYDNNHKVYIRYGGNANDGSAQHEVIVLDEKGNIDKDTPFLLDYNNVSYITEYRIDDKPITISGGLVTTLANEAPCAYTYYSRNISVQRSNVTIRGLEHEIKGEGDTGAPYSGFVSAGNLNNMLLENCVFQAHRMYVDQAVGGYGTSMGTYELGGSNANRLYYKNCTQSNFRDPEGNPSNTWYDSEGNTAISNVGKTATQWGVMGTNYCKNITYDACILNRLDAHAGVYNASVINGTETISINLIGGGTALIKDSAVYNSVIAELRSDYGSTWNGEVVIDNVQWITTKENPYMIGGSWVNHHFGYTTYLPNVTVNNLTLNGSATTISIFSGFGLAGSDTDPTAEKIGEVTNVNRMAMPTKIKVTNSNEETIEFIPTDKTSKLYNILLGVMEIGEE